MPGVFVTKNGLTPVLDGVRYDVGISPPRMNAPCKLAPKHIGGLVSAVLHKMVSVSPGLIGAAGTTIDVTDVVFVELERVQFFKYLVTNSTAETPLPLQRVVGLIRQHAENSLAEYVDTAALDRAFAPWGLEYE